jgi:hypothetical protein
MDLAFCKDRLSAAGVSFDDSLTVEEFSAIEREYGFHFPPDLREFLSYALPVSDGWLDWRRESRTEILRRLEWPLEGMCFDISNNAFWLDSWGPKPPALSDAYAVAREAVAKAPRLIPIFGHRYLPDRPREAEIQYSRSIRRISSTTEKICLIISVTSTETLLDDVNILLTAIYVASNFGLTWLNDLFLNPTGNPRA